LIFTSASVPSLPGGSRELVHHDQLVAVPGIDSRVEEHQDFVALLRKMWRQRWLIMAFVVLAAVAAAVIATSLPRHYVANARIMVGIPQPRFYPADSNGAVPDASAGGAEQAQSESYVLQSRRLAKEVVDKLHLGTNPDFNTDLAPSAGPIDGLISRLPVAIAAALPGSASAKAEDRTENRMIDQLLNDTITVSPLGRSNVIDIEADTTNPDLSALIANALATFYIDQKKSNESHASSRLEAYFKDRIDNLRQAVLQSDQAVENYRRENGLYRVGNNNQDMTAQTLGMLNAQVAAGVTGGGDAGTSVGAGSAGADTLSDVLGSPLIQTLKEQQAQAARHLAELRSTYGPDYPRVRDAEAELESIDGKISAEVGRAAQGARRRARAAEAHYAALTRRFEKTKSQMGTVNQKTIHLMALERDAAINGKLLEDTLSRAKQVMGQQDIRQPEAELISQAAAPLWPTYPPRMLILLLGMVVGALGGSMAALLREGADVSFRNAEQIEAATGLPVMSLIPNLGSTKSPTSAVLRDPLSLYGESLRRLFIMLAMSEAARSPKTVLFCSAVPGEAKSVTVVSMCRLLANAGKRVLLIDCDWRSPSVHKLLQRPNTDGLEAILADTDADPRDVIGRDPHSGLDFITAGRWSPHRSHLLNAQRMSEILSALSEYYDLIILDSPPVLVGAEVLPLASVVDKVVFLVRWGHTPRSAVMDALRQLVEARADFAGLAFSRVDAKRYRQYTYTPQHFSHGSAVFRRIGPA
jgi:polysaccharide biosynthesis transport protein